MIAASGPNLSTNSQRASDEIVDLATGENVLLAINCHKHKSIYITVYYHTTFPINASLLL